MERPDIYPGTYNMVENAFTNIVDIVASVFGTNLKRMQKDTRQRVTVLPRQVCMTLLFHYTNMTVIEIGGLFGRNHATVNNARKSVESWMLDKGYYGRLVHECMDIAENTLKKVR